MFRPSTNAVQNVRFVPTSCRVEVRQFLVLRYFTTPASRYGLKFKATTSRRYTWSIPPYGDKNLDTSERRSEIRGKVLRCGAGEG